MNTRSKQQRSEVSGSPAPLQVSDLHSAAARRSESSARAKTTNQVRAIFGSAKAANLDEEALRDVVADVTKRTRSISNLTYIEAERVIQRLKGASFVPLRTLQHRRAKAGVKQMVQKSQLDLIAELASQRSWSAATLEEFCLKVCKRRKPLTTDEAGKVIEGLKAMNKRDDLWDA